jgi:hypothetical protein
MRTIKVKLATPGKLVHNPGTASPLPGHKPGEECTPVDVPDAKYWHRMIREGSVELVKVEEKKSAPPMPTEETKVPDIGGKPKK